MRTVEELRAEVERMRATADRELEETLRRVREAARRRPLEDLALESGLSISTCRRFVSGEGEPTLRTVARLAAVTRSGSVAPPPDD